MNRMDYDEMLERQATFLQACYDRYYSGQRTGGGAPTEISVAEFARSAHMKPNTMYRLLKGQNLANMKNILDMARSPLIGPGIFSALLTDEELHAIHQLTANLPERNEEAFATAEP